MQEEQSANRTGKGGSVGIVDDHCRGGSGRKKGSGFLGVKTSAPGLYLEIMELDCEWLEEVVAALS